MHALVKPKFFMPVHGEQRHLKVHAQLAQRMGMNPKNIVISETGRVVEVTRDRIKLAGSVPSGRVLVDGYGVGDVGSVVLRDRKRLAEDGVIVVVLTLSGADGSLITGPDIVTRGFVYRRHQRLRSPAYHRLGSHQGRGQRGDLQLPV